MNGEKRFESRRFSSHRKTANTWRGFRNRPTTRADRIRPITGPTYTPVVRKARHWSRSFRLERGFGDETGAREKLSTIRPRVLLHASPSFLNLLSSTNLTWFYTQRKSMKNEMEENVLKSFQRLKYRSRKNAMKFIITVIKGGSILEDCN